MYVRPMLEYASCIWSPHQLGSIKKVESVQRKFTKRLRNFASLDNKTRLQQLGLESLEVRRLRQDLLYTNNILFGHISTDGVNAFELVSSAHSSFARGHGYKLFPRQNRLNSRKYFFTERVINPWNSLPAEPKDFKSVTAFKHFVNDVDLSRFVSLGF